MKHTLEEVRERVKELGGECLSDTYKNTRTSMEWRCKAGHVWAVPYKSILEGNWCKKCAVERQLKYTIEDVQRAAHERGGKCLSTAYRTTWSRIRWMCQVGHIWVAPYRSILEGRWCKICRHRSQAKRRRSGHGEITGFQYSRIRTNARDRDLPFDVSIQYLWELFEQQGRRCALSGRELVFKDYRTEARVNGKTKMTASLDRIDSSKGYVIGNVQWVHKDINQMKWQFTQEYFIEICQKVVDYKRGKG
jgi:hypothetical protein